MSAGNILAPTSLPSVSFPPALEANPRRGTASAGRAQRLIGAVIARLRAAHRARQSAAVERIMRSGLAAID